MTTTDKPLSAIQLLILGTAAARPDGMILPLPAELAIKGASRRNLLAFLLKRELVEEVLADDGSPCWRCDEQCVAYGLRLTAAGAMACGAPSATGTVVAEEVDSAQSGATSQIETFPEPATPDEASTPSASSPGGKLGQVLTVVSSPAGATLAELVSLTGWLPHTTRAALTRLKQRGYPIQLVKAPAGKAYRLAPPAAA